MIDIESEMADAQDKPFQGLEAIQDVPIAPAHGIAAVALNMAMKYHDLAIIKDGAMYQQYKLEGRNIREIDIDQVFETAIKIEVWLLGASDRIAKIVIDCVKDAVIEAEDDPPAEATTVSDDR